MQTIVLTLEQVAGYAVGGGHVLHMVCDLTIAADNAVFGQTGPKVLESNPLPIPLNTHNNKTYNRNIFSI